MSTDDQTTENQERELRAAAEAKGLDVVHVYQDNGISGAKGRDKRPGLDAALKDAKVWSVDRLGRTACRTFWRPYRSFTGPGWTCSY